MNTLSRTENSKRNLINGIINQSLILVLTFISRTIFIKYLGAEYLGINGLYSNILQLLSLTEFGLSNIILFTLYKPIREKNEKQICEYIYFFKKLYNIIFVLILGIGLLLIPLLPYIVNSNLNTLDLIGYYVLSVINIALSYIFVHYQMLITADQRIGIVKSITTIVIVVQNIVQIAILILTKNYYLYLIIQCIFTILSNIIIAIKAKKMYPFLKNKEILPKNNKIQVLKNTKDLFIYKLCVVIVNSTDNIIISILLGTIFVGYYSNYFLIISCIMNFINIFINSITASIGNLNASNNEQQKYEIFKHLVFIFQWITGILSICLLLLSNDFINLWLGKEYLLSNFTVLILVFNFYIQTIISPVWIYRETLGLYSKVKYIMLATAILNIVLSIILGKVLGLAGICLATVISRLCTTVILEPRILYKEYFKKSTKEYYLLQLKYIITFIIITIICSLVSILIPSNNIILWILKALLIFILSNLGYLIIYHKSNSFKYFKQKVIKKI